MRTYVDQNRANLNKAACERNKANPAAARVRRARWSVKNKERLAALNRARRTRKTLAGGSHTAEEWSDLKKRYDYRCLACGKAEPEIKLTADHVVAVANNGSSDISNLQPLCQPCNTSKGTKTIDYRVPIAA
jgi:5-methylcytosine-specific restriction endonuclease McrA